MRTTGLLALAQSERGECIPANFFDLYKFSTGFMVALMSPHGLDSENSSEQVKEKVDLLREVIRRVQEGEDVDVEGLLGTGDEVKEKEWEKVVEELQAEEKSRKMPSEKTRNPASEGSEHRT
ncbi:MAG: hypothetical protein M4579_004232 [Chaenotheca gracillima]|nr:MAG: hypothetical protein M4579_004232 [Chaenotheca gracillima]